MKKILLTFALTLIAMVVVANHPWLTQVYDYQPAPGQFINTLPACSEGEPKDSVLARCRANICGRVDTTTTTVRGVEVVRIDTTWAESMISLGGYGGYVIVGFDHPVVNMHTYDFDIYGNAFVSNRDSGGGSSEPGIVMVGVDIDGDGVPSDNDLWYELAGSEYYQPTTLHDYSITYYRPDANKTATPSTTNSFLTDTTYIRWTSNDVKADSTSGYMSRNSFHQQSYWPLWQQDEPTISFTGTKMRCNAVDQGNNGGNAYFVQYFFGLGYVDNLPNNSSHVSAGDSYMDGPVNPGFKIDWAVDANGKSVSLSHIDFVKIYTGVNQYCGWLGETSTEVAGGIDYHPDATLSSIKGDVNGDGEVSIADINAIIEVINADGYSSDADVNGDGSVTIADINGVVDIMIGLE